MIAAEATEKSTSYLIKQQSPRKLKKKVLEATSVEGYS